MATRRCEKVPYNRLMFDCEVHENQWHFMHLTESVFLCSDIFCRYRVARIDNDSQIVIGQDLGFAAFDLTQGGILVRGDIAQQTPPRNVAGMGGQHAWHLDF